MKAFPFNVISDIDLVGVFNALGNIPLPVLIILCLTACIIAAIWRLPIL
jgi:hypothetical protein